MPSKKDKITPNPCPHCGHANGKVCKFIKLCRFYITNKLK